MSRPHATFVIPCFNHGRFLRKAVDSALSQADADVRVVIVDDGSTDGHTPRDCDACAGPLVTVVHQENRGLSGARNRGAREATGEFLVFLDADDWVGPRFVAKLWGRLEAERRAGRAGDVSHVYCQERLAEQAKGVWRVPDWDPVLLLITNLHPVTALVRRECFEGAGGFDESMRDGYEDWDLWLRFAERGWRGVRHREALFVWRRHSQTTMIMRAMQHHDRLYRTLIDRHRPMYERHALELVARTNDMLRRFDANWIDESGYPIPLKALWRVRESYEAMAAVRLHRVVRKTIESMPGPLARGLDSMLRAAKKKLPSEDAISRPPNPKDPPLPEVVPPAPR